MPRKPNPEKEYEIAWKAQEKDLQQLFKILQRHPLAKHIPSEQRVEKRVALAIQS